MIKRFSPLLLAVLALGFLTTRASAQDAQPMTLQDAINGYESATNGHAGVVEDWSSHHLFFSVPDPGTATYDRVTHDPRYWSQQLRRLSYQDADDSDTSFAGGQADKKKAKKPKLKKRVKLKKDWSVDLGAGANVGAGQYPAKFGFNPSTISCANDFLVFNTSLAGTGTQASLVGFSNIYSGCGGTVPSVLWAYNTAGGLAQTSPTISFDATGTQVAFVQSVGTTASLVLLKWNPSTPGHTPTGSLIATSPQVTLTVGTFTQADVGAQISGTNIPANDTIAAVLSSTTANLATAPTAHAAELLTIHAETVVLPGVPPTVTAANYRACTAPCMTTFSLGTGVNDSNSAPFYDFSTDALWVGADNGDLYKFTGVFNGTPAAAGGSWPVAVSSDLLNSPVYDQTTGNVFVTEQNVNGGDGAVFRVSGSATPGTPVTTERIAHGPGLTDAVLVDSAAARIYAFSPDDTIGGAFSSVYQFTTSFAANSAGTVEHVGAASGTPGRAIFAGTFDNIYFNSASSTSPTGNLLCVRERRRRRHSVPRANRRERYRYSGRDGDRADDDQCELLAGDGIRAE